MINIISRKDDQIYYVDLKINKIVRIFNYSWSHAVFNLRPKWYY